MKYSAARLLKTQSSFSKHALADPDATSFALLHLETLEDPLESINAKDNSVTLMSLDEREAAFAVAPKHVDVFSSSCGPFVYRNQFKEARELIIMPLQMFKNIGTSMEPARSKVLLLSNTGKRYKTVSNFHWG